MSDTVTCSDCRKQRPWWLCRGVAEGGADAVRYTCVECDQRLRNHPVVKRLVAEIQADIEDAVLRDVKP